MKRILATTAIVLSMSGAALAESHSTSMGKGAFGSVEASQSDFFASDLIGMRIYKVEKDMDETQPIADGAETEWDDIGEINDLIVDADGNVTAVILGIGGFLGIGERDVSVSMDAIKVLREDGDSDDRFLVVNTTREELEAAPEFDRDMDEEMEADAEAAAENTESEAEAAVDADKDREMLMRPAVERDGYVDADYATLTADKMEGARLYGVNDEDVGEVETLILDDSGKITHVLADIGGFLGMGERTVKLSFEELQVVRNESGDEFRIYVDSTEEALENLPEYAD